MKVKGMRDIPTPSGLIDRVVPKTRAKAAAELARLEDQKARLERELNLWTCNRNQAEARLHLTQQRIAFLKQALEDERQASSVEDKPAGGEYEAGTWREVTLEY